jgi:hypothetical protein
LIGVFSEIHQEMRMSPKISAAILAAVIVAVAPVAAKAQDKTIGDAVAPTVSITAAQQFGALPADAMIAVNGERMTKLEFLTRRARQRAEMMQKIIDMQSESKALAEAKRGAFFATQHAKLAEANAAAQAAAQRWRAQEAAGRPPDYDARVEQGIALLKRAKTASPEELAQMQIQAREIVKSVDPEAAKQLAQ